MVQGRLSRAGAFSYPAPAASVPCHEAKIHRGAARQLLLQKTARFLSNQTGGTVQELNKELQHQQENCILGKFIVLGITDYC